MATHTDDFDREVGRPWQDSGTPWRPPCAGLRRWRPCPGGSDLARLVSGRAMTARCVSRGDGSYGYGCVGGPRLEPRRYGNAARAAPADFEKHNKSRFEVPRNRGPTSPSHLFI